MVKPPAVLLLFGIVVAALDFLYFYMKKKNCYFMIYEELCWSFVGSCIEFVDFLVGWSFLLCQPYQSMGMGERAFHLLILSSVSFFSVLKFLSYNSFTFFKLELL